MKSALAILTLASLLLTGCMAAESHYQNARQILEQRHELTLDEQKQAYYHLREAAAAGNAQAAYDLAWLYNNYDLDAPEDVEDGYELWLRQAAEMGLPQAQHDLGEYEIYNNNRPEGLAWIEKAAQAANNPQWQFELSRLYYCAHCSEMDDYNQKSFAWALQAAQNGLVTAQSHVGYCYDRGLGVEKDYDQAYVWTQKAALGKDVYAQNNLAIMCEYGLGTEVNYDNAIYWYNQALEQGFAAARTSLAVLYIYTAPPPVRDQAKGFELLQNGAEQGDSRAMSVLGECYEYGAGVRRDLKQAFFWQEKSHKAGYYIASYYLGRMYLNGVGVVKNPRQAFELFQISARQEEWGGAKCALGDMYRLGLGVSRNYQQALEWYEKAAGQNNQRAMYELGRMYEKGLGVKANTQLALTWYNKALGLSQDELRPSYTEQSLSSTDPVARTSELAGAAIIRLAK